MSNHHHRRANTSARVSLHRSVRSTTAVAGTALSGLNLVYIYDVRRATADVPTDDELSPLSLLAPPAMTNRLPWSRGYFETLERRELEPSDELDIHCFRDSRGRWFDENGRELPGPIEPVGQRGVHSFRTIDDLVSDALGIARA